MDELRPEFLQAVGLLYKVAGHLFGSLDLEWSVAIWPPDPSAGYIGPEFQLRVIDRRGPHNARRKWAMRLTDALVRNASAEQIERLIIDKTREVRESVRSGETEAWG